LGGGVRGATTNARIERKGRGSLSKKKARRGSHWEERRRRIVLGLPKRFILREQERKSGDETIKKRKRAGPVFRHSIRENTKTKQSPQTGHWGRSRGGFSRGGKHVKETLKKRVAKRLGKEHHNTNGYEQEICTEKHVEKKDFEGQQRERGGPSNKGGAGEKLTHDQLKGQLVSNVGFLRRERRRTWRSFYQRDDARTPEESC